MAKTSNTNPKNINDNFEALKAQMMKKRLKAEEAMDNIPESKEPSKKDTIMPVVTAKKEEASINKASSNYEEQLTEENSTGFLTVEVPQNKPSVQMNKIIIKKLEKPEQPKRITYYLRPETIKKIDLYSQMSGMGKSEFVQNILDTVLNNLEVEE